MLVRTRRHRSTRRRAKVVAFAPRLGTLRWVVDELAGEPYDVENVRTAQLLVARLTEEPPPRPLIAVADFDSMTPDEVASVESLRERGWGGVVIALGRPEVETREALRIQSVIPRPFGSETLRKAVSEISIDRTTQQIRAIAR